MEQTQLETIPANLIIQAGQGLKLGSPVIYTLTPREYEALGKVMNK